MKPRLRASVICEAEGHLLVVRLRDPVTGVEALYPPGGGVEEGETPAQTAVRETREETGLVVAAVEGLESAEHYPFHWSGVDYDVTTHFVGALLESPFSLAIPAVVDAPYNTGAFWIPSEEALREMAIHPPIAAASARMLRRLRRHRWQRHPNFQGPAATLLSIHDQFRLGAERLALLVDKEPASSLGWIARAFMPLSQMLHHHHHAEEDMLFPFVDRQTGTAPAELVADHEELTAAIEGVESALASTDRERARTAVATFDRVLVEHLDREEQLVVPVLMQLRPEEAWSLIHQP